MTIRLFRGSHRRQAHAPKLWGVVPTTRCARQSREVNSLPPCFLAPLATPSAEHQGNRPTMQTLRLNEIRSSTGDMLLLVLLALLFASAAHAQYPFEPNAAEVIGGQLGELGTSVGDYARLAGERRGRILKAERDLKECVARSCSNRPALEKELAKARADDATVRKFESALLADIGLPGFEDFGDFLRKTVAAINEEESRKRQEMAIVSSVEEPVKNWCSAGFKAQEVVEIRTPRGPSRVDCIMDILQGWATPIGMNLYGPDGRDSADRRDFYYILSKRELLAGVACDKQLREEFLRLPPGDKGAATRFDQKRAACAAQYSEVARLQHMYNERMAVKRATKQQEVEAAVASTARRTQECQGISEMQAQIAAKSRELGDARAKASQAEREYRRELATQRLPPQEARTRLEQKRAQLQADFGVDALTAQRVELEKKLLDVQRACAAAR